MKKLDGSEVVRPEAQFDETAAAELRDFNARAPLTAFGNSDYRGPTVIGFSRTYVFATARTADAVMDALRARRPVVYDRIAPTASRPLSRWPTPTADFRGISRQCQRRAG